MDISSPVLTAREAYPPWSSALADSIWKATSKRGASTSRAEAANCSYRASEGAMRNAHYDGGRYGEAPEKLGKETNVFHAIPSFIIEGRIAPKGQPSVRNT